MNPQNRIFAPPLPSDTENRFTTGLSTVGRVDLEMHMLFSGFGVTYKCGYSIASVRLSPHTHVASPPCDRSEYDGQLELDLGNLCAWDPGHISAEELKADPDGTCLRLATAMTQTLVAAIFRLPSEASSVGLSLVPTSARG